METSESVKYAFLECVYFFFSIYYYLLLNMNQFLKMRKIILVILLLIICEGINVQQVEYDGRIQK